MQNIYWESVCVVYAENCWELKKTWNFSLFLLSIFILKLSSLCLLSSSESSLTKPTTKAASSSADGEKLLLQHARLGNNDERGSIDFHFLENFQFSIARNFLWRRFSNYSQRCCHVFDFSRETVNRKTLTSVFLVLFTAQGAKGFRFSRVLNLNHASIISHHHARKDMSLTLQLSFSRLTCFQFSWNRYNKQETHHLQVQLRSLSLKRKLFNDLSEKSQQQGFRTKQTA